MNLSKLAIAMVLALSATTVRAEGTGANVAGPLWTCELQTTNLRGASVAFGKAFSIARGKGNVHCTSVNGAQETDTPVRIHLLGAGMGVGFTYFKQVHVRSFAAGLSTPNDMFGTLKLEKEFALTVINRGISAAPFVSLNRAGVSGGVEFSAYKAYGLEASVQIKGILITPSKAKKAPAEQEIVAQQ